LDSLLSFWKFFRAGEFRFYQERDLGLDLYHCGWPGLALGALGVASAVVFLLAIFHVIPKRRHVVALLLGLGTLAFIVGAATAYYHFLELEALAPRLIRETAGPAPANEGQRAAVIVLPLIVGALTLAGDVLGCLYMAVFWGGSLLARKRSPRSTHE
jgi:hypothetical protein